MSNKKCELSEDDALEIAAKDHPEWEKAWRNATLPDEIIGEDGEPMSPQAHLCIHAVVERQLAADDPKGIVAIAALFKQVGFSDHDVRHDIGCVLAEQMSYMSKEGCDFDEERYLEDLQEVAESHR